MRANGRQRLNESFLARSMSETIHSTHDSRNAMRPRRSMAWRIAGFAAAVLMALGCVLAIKERTWTRIEQLKEEFAAIESERFLLGLHARESIGRLNSALLRFQLSGSPAERDEFQRVARDLGSRLHTTLPQLATVEEQRDAAEFKSAFEQYLLETADMIEAPVRGIRRDTAAEVHGIIAGKSKKAGAAAEALVLAQRDAWKTFFGGSRHVLASLQRLLWISVLALLGFIALITALIFRAFVAPLRLQLGKSQELIEQQEKLASLGVLAAGVAHEIRNPLTAIKMRLFSLRKSLPSPARNNEDLAIINSEIDRLEGIVKDTLQFARPAEPAFAEIPAAELLGGVERLLATQLARRNIELTVEPAGDLVLRIDRQQVQQVLINLVQNAADSISGSGAITLRARSGVATFSRRAQPATLIEVSDTGKGIASDAERWIFDPFFSTKESGTGLGLSIAARIVEKHGGVIQYATRLHQGTTFTIVLPRNSPDESTHSPDRR
jgi:signal transduction histidine kinase